MIPKVQGHKENKQVSYVQCSWVRQVALIYNRNWCQGKTRTAVSEKLSLCWIYALNHTFVFSEQNPATVVQHKNKAEYKGHKELYEKLQDTGSQQRPVQYKMFKSLKKKREPAFLQVISVIFQSLPLRCDILQNMDHTSVSLPQSWHCWFKRTLKSWNY